MLCIAVRWLFRAAFLAALVAAVTAGWTGLDPDQKWGPFRLWLLALGLLGLGLPAAGRIIRNLDLRLMGKTQERVEPPPNSLERSGTPGEGQPPSPIPSGLQEQGPASDDRTRWRIGLGVRWASSRAPILLPLLAVWGLYVWFVSIGQITTWPPTTKYYSMLAEAFLQGHTNLSVSPPFDLSSVEDPYHHSNLGNNLTYVVEFAYFQGKYYVYYGPAPAMLIAPVIAVFHQIIGDQVVTFAGMFGSSLFAALILLRLQRSYFPRLPSWLVATGILFVGTAHPMLWMLTWAAVYPAAISCGQAFMLAGIFFALPSIAGSEMRAWRFLAAGLLWGLSLGSRVSLIGAVAALSVATLWGMARITRRLTRGDAERAILLLMPLVISVSLLSAYNYVRFGDVFETGLGYSLNLGDPYYLVRSGRLFNISYFIPNLFYFLVTPVNKIDVFPFIRPVRESPAMFTLFLSRFGVLDTHSVERITGLLLAAPYCLFSASLVSRLACHPEAAREKKLDGFRRSSGVILLAALLASLPVLLYYLVSSRFLMDFSPLLFIGAVVGSWLLYRMSEPYPIQGSIITVLIILAVIYSLVVSFLLAMTGEATLFDDYNPALWQWLRSLASW